MIRTPLFPARFRAFNRTHVAVVGMGGNVGHTIRRLERLIHFLKKEPWVSLHETSVILKNPPFGYTKQAMFYNTVMVVSTALSPQKLLDALLRVERKFGRRRSFKNAPRTLDLDLLFYDSRTLDTPTLCLPHPHWYKRTSVVFPLAKLGALR